MNSGARKLRGVWAGSAILFLGASVMRHLDHITADQWVDAAKTAALLLGGGGSVVPGAVDALVALGKRGKEAPSND